MTVLRRVPLWVWMTVAALLYFGAHEWRLQRHMAALQGEVDKGKTEAIRQAREAAQGDIRGIESKEGPLLKALGEVARAAEAAATKKEALDATLARTEASGKRLVDTGTVDETVAAGLKVGLHPRAVPRMAP